MTWLFRKLPHAVQEYLLELAFFLQLDKAWFWPKREEHSKGSKLRGLWLDTIIGTRRATSTPLRRSTLICYWLGCGLSVLLMVWSFVLLVSMTMRELSFEAGTVSAEEIYPDYVTRYTPLPASELPVRRIEGKEDPNLNQVELPDGTVVDFPDTMSVAEITKMMSLSYQSHEWKFVHPDSAVLEVSLPDGEKLILPGDTPEEKVRGIVERVDRKHQLAKRRSALIMRDIWAMVGYLIASFAAFGLGRAALYFVGGV